MKRIIDHKLYDTDTATLIYSDNSIRKHRNYYRTGKGTYFCHYVYVGKIELVDEQVIMDILAEKDVDKYIELFGKVTEG